MSDLSAQCAGAGLRLDQLLGNVVRDLDGFLDRAALRDVHLVAGRQVHPLGQLLDVQWNHEVYSLRPLFF